ncbi:MAG: cation:proton antiporter [Clostridia bacterium]|nr:cation:proton antiporter [Clostridia bacterium]
MLTSLAILFLCGFSVAEIFRRLKLPRVVGMLLSGIILGPFVLDLLDPTLLGISAELRKIALIIILIKAGLSLDIKDLKKVGRPAVLLSFLPAVFEIIACVIFAPIFLEVSRTEAALIGAVLGAVSPAVVVPKMVQLMDNKIGTDKAIPQLILAGASLDDVFVIVLFTAFLGMVQGNGISAIQFADIPVSIILGTLAGVLCGFLIYFIYRLSDKLGNGIRNTVLVIVILSFGFLLNTLEAATEKYVAISGMLAVISMALIIKIKIDDIRVKKLAESYGNIWIAAEVILFVLIGAAVNIKYTFGAGGKALVLILTVLIFRSAGVVISLIGTELNFKERLFCVIAYLPKATVQAAIGGVPLALGLDCGEIVLSVAVLSILITAPLGAIGMDLTDKKLLNKC